jgi:hypothetical protein
MLKRTHIRLLPLSLSLLGVHEALDNAADERLSSSSFFFAACTSGS